MAGSRRIRTDASGTPVQLICPNPLLSSNHTITAGDSLTISITSWLVLRFTATGELQVKLNDNTAYWPCYEDSFTFDGLVSSVTFTNATAASITLSIMGM